MPNDQKPLTPLCAEALKDKQCGPGTPIAIIDAMFAFAERECGHNPASARHALTTIINTIEALREQLASIKLQRGMEVEQYVAENEALREQLAQAQETLQTVYNCDLRPGCELCRASAGETLRAIQNHAALHAKQHNAQGKERE